MGVMNKSSKMLLWLMGLILFSLLLTVKNSSGKSFSLSSTGVQMDLISSLHLLLVLVITYLMISGLGLKSNSRKLKMLLILLLGFLLIFSFLVKGFFYFFIFFEFSVIPMVMLMVSFGKNSERLVASTYLFLYTFLGSLPLLMKITLLKGWFGTSSFSSLKYFIFENLFLGWSALNYISLLGLIGWLMSFFVKFPILGFHYWLPKAHVEASTFGSMILAGVLLKLGSYGFIRLEKLLNLSKESWLKLTGLMMNSFYLWLVMSLIMSGFLCFRQNDLKSLVAYSSIVHMGLIAVCLFNFTLLSVAGSLIVVFSHGLISSGLFFIMGGFYLLSKSRSILVKTGWGVLKCLMIFFFLITISLKMAFPPTLSFMGELLMMKSVMDMKILMTPVLILNVLMVGLYKVMIYSVLSHGKGFMKISSKKKVKLVALFHCHLALYLMFGLYILL